MFVQQLMKNLIDAAGIQPIQYKVKATHDAPRPKCKEVLQTFLGLLNFTTFSKNKATKSEPLQYLLDKGAQWK